MNLLGQELGLENFTPPCMAPTTVGSVILQGVNYASGAGGILDETGKFFVSVPFCFPFVLQEVNIIANIVYCQKSSMVIMVFLKITQPRNFEW